MRLPQWSSRTRRKCKGVCSAWFLQRHSWPAPAKCKRHRWRSLKKRNSKHQTADKLQDEFMSAVKAECTRCSIIGSIIGNRQSHKYIIGKKRCRGSTEKACYYAHCGCPSIITMLVHRTTVAHSPSPSVKTQVQPFLGNTIVSQHSRLTYPPKNRLRTSMHATFLKPPLNHQTSDQKGAIPLFQVTQRPREQGYKQQLPT